VFFNSTRRHPAVDFGGGISLGLTHSPDTFKKKNKRLRKNTAPDDKTPAYVVKRIQRNDKHGKDFSNAKIYERDAMKLKHLIKKLERKEFRNNKRHKKRVTD
jgi:hypothetical protein